MCLTSKNPKVCHMSFALSTNLGPLHLRSPVIVGSCPLSAIELQRIAMVSNHAGAIALPSLDEEDCKSRQTDGYNKKVDDYLRLVERAKSNTSVPIIASLSGTCLKAWHRIAKRIETAGADALELSVRQPNPNQFENPSEIENAIVASANVIHEAVGIPLFVKLTRGYTSIAHLAQRLEPFVQGLVMFGRDQVIDIQLDRMTLQSDWELTPAGSIVQSLEKIMCVRSLCPELPLAASGGIRNSEDVIKALLAGANAVMITSAIYREGATVIRTLIEGLSRFMESHEMASIAELKRQAPLLSSVRSRPSFVDGVEPVKDFAVEHSEITRGSDSDRWGHYRPADG